MGARGRGSAEAAALGVVRVVNSGMERALRAVSVERGHDPRAFTLVTFGGAGGLHAVELARHLRIPRVLVPASPGALSAVGALRAEVLKTLSRTVMLEVGDEARGRRRARADEEDDASHAASTRRRVAQLERLFAELEREARAALTREGFAGRRQRHERTLAARYKGQSFELEIAWGGGRRLVERFHREHEARYGYAQEAGAVEIVSARLRSAGLVEELEAEPPRRAAGTRAARPHASAQVHFEGGRRATALYRREDLRAGHALSSPCVVTEYSSTTLVPPGARARVDAHGNLLIEP
jgi:N-methylhydantoinase A